MLITMDEYRIGVRVGCPIGPPPRPLSSCLSQVGRTPARAAFTQNAFEVHTPTQGVVCFVTVTPINDCQ